MTAFDYFPSSERIGLTQVQGNNDLYSRIMPMDNQPVVRKRETSEPTLTITPLFGAGSDKQDLLLPAEQRKSTENEPTDIKSKAAILFNSSTRDEEKLAVVRDLVKASVTSLAGTDVQGNQYSLRFETVPAGKREMVQMFATGPDGKERTVLRAIAKEDGSFEQQRNRSGTHVSYRGKGFESVLMIQTDSVSLRQGEGTTIHRHVPHRHDNGPQSERTPPLRSRDGQSSLSAVLDAEIQRQVPGAVYIGQGGMWMHPTAANAWNEAKQILAADGIDLRANSSGRTTSEQARIYRRYLAGKVSLAARPGNSNHERGISADVANLVNLGSREAQRVMKVLRYVGFVPGDRGKFLKNDEWHWTYRGGMRS